MQIKKGAALMSDLFENYEEEYRGLAADIQKKLSDVTTYETNAGKPYAPSLPPYHHHYQSMAQS